jgi:hypothetical protein
MSSADKRDWKEICKAASKELDSEKLMTLVSELMRALEDQKSRSRQALEP